MTFKLKDNEQYMFATDLDGTFLASHDGSFHILNYLAVRKIKEAGHKFVITTGRSWWWTSKIYNQLEAVDAAIHFSGAQVHHPTDENFKSYAHFIPAATIKKILRDYNILDRAERVNVAGPIKHGELESAEYIDLIDFDALELVITLKNLTDSDDKSNEKLSAELKEVLSDYTVRLWKYNGFDHFVISPKGTDKWKSLQYVAKHYGIKEENIIYFGDNINDIEALQNAGYSYAPQNAKPMALENAKEIIAKNNEDGAVAHQMLKLLEK